MCTYHCSFRILYVIGVNDEAKMISNEENICMCKTWNDQLLPSRVVHGSDLGSLDTRTKLVGLKKFGPESDPINDRIRSSGIWLDWDRVG